MFKKLPHTYVIIFYIILFAALLTWIVPGGEFEREKVEVGGSERTVIVKDSYHSVPRNIQTWQIFAAMFRGIEAKADIVVFIFIVGGAFMIITKTKAIDTGIHEFITYSNRLRNKFIFKKIDIDHIIFIVIIFVFSMFGAVFGMSEETIPFVMIFIPLAVSMGYDSIVGVSLVFVAAAVGFAGAILNPFTIGIAQTIAGIEPLFSGFQYRFVVWMLLNIITVVYILRYAKKIKKKPSASPVFEDDEFWRRTSNQTHIELIGKSTGRAWLVFGFISLALILFSVLYPQTELKIGNEIHTKQPLIPIFSAIFVIGGFFSLRKSPAPFILHMLMSSIMFLIIGVMGYGWYISEIATLFFALGLFAGAAAGFSPNDITKHFLFGVKDIASAALIVGFAGGIITILEDGKIIDTILYEVSNSITGFGHTASISVMFLFQSMINVFIPSGSGQAALTMPIMAPLSDLIGVSRQSAVLAFQFGDGFTNMITPTSGVLIGVLGVAKIPYEKWFKFILPFIIILTIAGILLLIPTVTMKLPGF